MQQENQQDQQFIPPQEQINKEYQKVSLEQQKKIPQEHLIKGRQLLKKQQYMDASKQFSKCIMAIQYLLSNGALSPEQSQLLPKSTLLPAYSNLSLCYLKLKLYQSVTQLTNQVLAIDQSHIKCRYRRAVASYMSKEYDQALGDLNILKNLLGTRNLENQSQFKEIQELNKKCKQGIKKQRQNNKKVAKQWMLQKQGLNYPDRPPTKQQKREHLQKMLAQIQKQNNTFGSKITHKICECLFKTWKAVSRKFKRQ